MILPLEKQVCSLESAKRLKELGVKQESLFYWREMIGIDSGFKTRILFRDYIVNKYGDMEIDYSAFTCAEPLTLLPETIRYKEYTYALYIMPQEINGTLIFFVFYYNSVVDKRIETISNEIFVEAVSKMLIYLLENKLITLESVNGK